MILCGLDEVGRGAFAGPIVACAVILKPDNKLQGLADSKSLNHRQRNALIPQILEQSCLSALSWATVEEINNKGIGWANKEIFYRLIRFIQADHFIVDGNLKLNLENKHIESIIKADTKIDAVMAASILAKVSRDTLMADQAKFYSQYGWETNAGYGTQKHRETIRIIGPCSYHRSLFIRSV